MNKGKKKKPLNWDRVEEFIEENYDVRYNVILDMPEFRIRGGGYDWQDLKIDDIFRALQKNGISFSLSHLNSLLMSDFVSKYNPVIEYFKALNDPINYYAKRVGNRDIIKELCKFIKTDDDLRFEHHFRKMLVRVIACAIDGKVVNKQAFILVDENQNSGKTSFLRWLCPSSLSPYYTESMSTDREGLIALARNIFINLDEMAVMSKYDINKLKSVLSQDFPTARPLYGRRAQRMTRIASFFGSTNKTDFLSDETGTVRWLCFKLIAQIDFNYSIQIDVHELWYCAYQLYLSGFDYKLTKQEIEENEVYNRNFHEITPELELLEQKFEPSSKDEGGDFMTTTQVTEAMQNDTKINLKLNVVGKALKTLGFVQTQKHDSEKKYPIKGYYVKLK
jgi:predicted P-loop ATPase